LTGAEASGEWPWGELGIEENADPLTIRRAYAARLRRIDPAREPDAFRRLRSAYEAAVRRTDQPAFTSRPAEVIVPGVDRTAIVPVEQALRAGDVAAAFRLFQAAHAEFRLSFAEMNTIEESFLNHVLPLPAGLFLAMVEWFDWNKATHRLRERSAPLFRRLDHRLDAERWYDELRRSAAIRRYRPFDLRPFAARLMMRGPPRWFELFGPTGWRLALGTPRRTLSGLIKQFDLYDEWLADRFDAARIRWCRNRMKSGSVYLIYIVVFTSVAPIAGFVDSHEVMPSLLAWMISLTLALQAWLVVLLTRWIGRVVVRLRSRKTAP